MQSVIKYAGSEFVSRALFSRELLPSLLCIKDSAMIILDCALLYPFERLNVSHPYDSRLFTPCGTKQL